MHYCSPCWPPAWLCNKPAPYLVAQALYDRHQSFSASSPPAARTCRVWSGRLSPANSCALNRLLGRAPTPTVDRQLEALLEADEGMYQISLLKHEPKDFSYGELRQEVARRKFFEQLHKFGQTFPASARQIDDNLVEAFIHLIDQHEKQAKLASEASAIKP
jgi:hypothetical protein